jgi:hypothetical protein
MVSSNSNIIPPDKVKVINDYSYQIAKIVNKWGFRDYAKSTKIQHVRLWLSNFECDEIPFMFNLLNSIYLIDEEKEKELLHLISCNISKKFDLKEIKILSLEEDRASSGSRFLYKLKKELCVAEPDIANDFNYFDTDLKHATHLVFIDDVIGTGEQASKLLKEWSKINNSCHYYSLLGLQKGIDYIKNETGISSFSAVVFPEKSKVFSEKSTLKNKEKCKEISLKYGEQLYYEHTESKRHPLGYEDSQLLICFRDDCPNNTLPIIWAGLNSELKGLKSTIWHPLFERKYVPKPIKESTTSKLLPHTPLGYFINIGTTSSRLFEVVDKENLREHTMISYTISDPKDDGYLEGIICHIKNEILPKMNGNTSQLFSKVFVDCNFIDVFNGEDQSVQKDFIREFYKQTNLYFNILSKTQTVQNLKRLFGNISDKTAIINIASHSVDIFVFSDGEFTLYSLDITLTDVRTFVEKEDFPEIWDDQNIKKIKEYIQERVIKSLQNITVENAIVIKDELRFMQDNGYPLKNDSGQLCLSQREYKKANQKILFTIDYKKIVEHDNKEISTRHRLYGFKFGHILIETILDLMKNKSVIPKNDLSIHGSINAYIFNVVLSGSTHNNGVAYMLEAHKIIKKMDSTILSPIFTVDGKLAKEITADTEYEHLKAIDECDVLLICNNSDDGYFGESTKCHIYYAYAQKKTIAFWRKPSDDKQLSFIPHEHWESIRELIT